MSSDYFEKLNSKKRVIDMIRDFIRFPSYVPETKYKRIDEYMDTLWRNKEISHSHYMFLKHVLEIECGLAMVNMGGDEKS